MEGDDRDAVHGQLEDRIEIFVADTGPGPAEEHHARGGRVDDLEQPVETLLLRFFRVPVGAAMARPVLDDLRRIVFVDAGKQRVDPLTRV